MTLHLVKLCVGADSLEDLVEWVDRRQAERKSSGKAAEHIHVTRMIPKRVEELLDGGSMFWVIRGNIQARQQLIDIRPFSDGEGIRRCELVMAPQVIPTQWQPRRAFQGWRYLDGDAAPSDLKQGNGANSLPPELRRELADLGLL